MTLWRPSERVVSARVAVNQASKIALKPTGAIKPAPSD